MRSKEPDLPHEIEVTIKAKDLAGIKRELVSIAGEIEAGYFASGGGGSDIFSRWVVHNTSPYYPHTYHDGRVQWDEDCERENCDGIARVQSAWAPDTGLNWLKCEKCGRQWNPGVSNFA